MAKPSDTPSEIIEVGDLIVFPHRDHSNSWEAGTVHGIMPIGGGTGWVYSVQCWDNRHTAAHYVQSNEVVAHTKSMLA